MQGCVRTERCTSWGRKYRYYHSFKTKNHQAINFCFPLLRNVRLILSTLGWALHDAMKVVKAVSHLDVYIEQPCISYRECLSLRSHTNLPFILDENISDLDHLVAVARDNAADVVNIKISKFGGLTKSKMVS